MLEQPTELDRARAAPTELRHKCGSARVLLLRRFEKAVRPLRCATDSRSSNPTFETRRCSMMNLKLISDTHLPNLQVKCDVRSVGSIRSDTERGCRVVHCQPEMSPPGIQMIRVRLDAFHPSLRTLLDCGGWVVSAMKARLGRSLR